MQINVAVVQFGIQPFAPAETLAEAELRVQQASVRIEQFIKKASSRADIIVFPENFLTVVLGDKVLADYESRYVQHFQRLAAEYNIDLVPGSFIEGDQDGLYNTTYYIDKTGSIRGKYRKINLWHHERLLLTPGDVTSVFDTQYGRVGLIICWDLMFPEVFRAMLQQGVELVICPSFWCFEDAGIGLKYDPDAETKLVDALCTARAFENEIILVYANAAGKCVGPEGILRLIGHSQITAPFTGPLHILPHSNQEMFIQSVDTAILNTAEDAYSIKKDLGVQA
ncbi:MAG TPA: carbon-nitrogen hydrolase family protein [Ktedonobacteraceae bacterium]|jgi:predicted amidohydrolase